MFVHSGMQIVAKKVKKYRKVDKFNSLYLHGGTLPQYSIYAITTDSPTFFRGIYSETEKSDRISGLTSVGLPDLLSIGHHTVLACASSLPSDARTISVCLSNAIREADPIHVLTSTVSPGIAGFL
jgi:hypothetical protein